ncbi:hypothetical protein AND_001926 [Anopheles darlingi]|uniref:Uncharacterized protein n=1 Tax=Anopheles darlingi TaxID=43151 RepID=W5JPH2_ANODA|nr:hypothetical protein AND_001926 [Anopheles darlingi]
MNETEAIVNNASDLLLLGAEVRNVPLKEIAKRSLSGLRHQESDIELYEFLFGNVITFFEPKEFEDEVSSLVLPELVRFVDKIQNELQTNALSYFFVENLTLLQRLADVLAKLIDYLLAQAESYRLYRSLTVFPEYLLRCYTIVRKNYVSMAQEVEVLEAMKALYGVCKKILTAFLELLCPRDTPNRTAAGSYFRTIEKDDERECLEKVCTVLASVGNEISPIDSLLASDVWKSIVKLCTEHAEGQLCTDKRPTGWFGNVVVILNTGVEVSFQELQSKNEASKQATIALKLNAFCLRVMLKLLTLSRQRVSSDVYQSIIGTLLHIKTCLRTQTLPSELVAGIEQYLHVSYMAIVESSLRTDIFAKALVNCELSTIDDCHSYFNLVMHMIEQIVTYSNDNSLVLRYCVENNLLQKIANTIEHSGNLLLSGGTLYRQLLVHCSALVLMGFRLRNRTAQRAIEETLVGMVLQERYCIALLGIDLWSVLVRYHSTQLLYEYFVFWMRVNNEYAPSRTRPEHVYVRTLLRNLYVFLPGVQKEKLLTTYPIRNSENDRLWVTVGLPSTDSELMVHRQQPLASVEERLQTRLKQLQQPSQHLPHRVDAFYEMMNLLSIAKSQGGIVNMLREWSSLFAWEKILTNPCKASARMLEYLEGSHVPLDNILRRCNSLAVSRSSTYAKYRIVLLLERANTPPEAVFEALLNDKEPLIAAAAFHLLRKLNSKRQPAAIALITREPVLQSRLAALQKNVPGFHPVLPAEPAEPMAAVQHRCQPASAAESTADMTLIINSKIDELFPDDDDDDEDVDAIDFDALAENVSPKRRKLDPSRSANRILDELETQSEELAKLNQTHKLEITERARLTRIMAKMKRLLESE